MKYIRCSQRVPAPSRALACLIARSSEREVRVGPKEKGQKMFAKTYKLECLAAVILHMFQVLKCFSAAECLHVTGLESSQTWTMPHPDQRGWSHNGDHQLTFLFVFISQRYSRFGVQFSHLAFFRGQHFPHTCRDRSVMALFSPQKDSPGETIHLARQKDLL